MNIHILCVGNTPPPEQREWIDLYLKRASAYAAVKLTRVKDSKTSWKELAKKIPDKSYRVLLDPAGKIVTTEQFAAVWKSAPDRGRTSICFLIGGSYGFPHDILQAADAKISLTALTLPHRLALLILTEQIYRVLSWKAGAPYHHA